MEKSPLITIQEPPTDVVELCALLQCLGFTVKSLDTSDVNSTQDGGSKTVVINCQSSGLHVVLENGSPSCSCPTTDPQNSGFWEVSGVTGGKHADKETGSKLLGSLPKIYRDHVTRELREIVRGIKEHNEPDPEAPKKEGINRSASLVELGTINKSASMVDLGTPPEKRLLHLKVDTPTRYRSLDTLTSAKDESAPLPAPGSLSKVVKGVFVEDGTEPKGKLRNMCRRQSTYTVSSNADSVSRWRNKTSSPIKQAPTTVLDSLIAAERAAEDLRSKLSLVIRELVDDGNNYNDSSMSSLALDVSKISLLKGAEGKSQFASSPNLSGIAATRESLTKSRLNRFDSASTSNLGPKKLQDKEGRMAKLKRLSPNIFKRKDTSSSSVKEKTQDGKNKLNSIFKPRITTTPLRIPKTVVEPSPNLSSGSARKKFSHVKSTIPRPASAKKE